MNPQPPDESPPAAPCPRCGGPAERLVEGLCPGCLARQVRSGMNSLLELASVQEEVAVEIDGIRILETLGAGGVGLVFRGVREVDGLPLAVKVLPRGLSQDPEWRERFQREAAALSALDDPAIVKIYGSGETHDGRLYLAMELVEGCDLRRLLRTGKLAPAQALDIAAKVAAALTHAHERGIVHRDIKPGNILVGENGIVKVADFGIARAFAGSASSFALTQTREAFGTPYYMAPEVAENVSAASPASDVYALGVMLYEMLMGRVPMGKFTPVSREVPLDHQCDRVIAGALADQVGDRISSMSEMLASLQGLKQRLTRRVIRRRWRLGLAMVGVLAASIGLSVWFTRQALTSVTFPPVNTASKARPWVNSLGMKFVPLPDHPVFISIWETRVQDFRTYAAANSLLADDDSLGMAPVKMHTIRDGEEVLDSGSWQDPGFAQTETDPVVGISVVNANHFCRWLTTKELAEGRLQKGQRYRLPTSTEWQAAFAAGTTGPGNVAGTEVLVGGWPARQWHGETTDAFPRTAPVGSFPANELGLLDLNGNVMEACLDLKPAPPNQRLRSFQTELSVHGDSWRGPEIRDSSAVRTQLKPFLRRADSGFRIVLAEAQTDETPTH